MEREKKTRGRLSQKNVEVMKLNNSRGESGRLHLAGAKKRTCARLGYLGGFNTFNTIQVFKMLVLVKNYCPYFQIFREFRTAKIPEDSSRIQ